MSDRGLLVGRVGALAVAVGIGTALLEGCPIALANDGATDGSNSSDAGRNAHVEARGDAIIENSDAQADVSSATAVGGDALLKAYGGSHVTNSGAHGGDAGQRSAGGKGVGGNATLTVNAGGTGATSSGAAGTSGSSQTVTSP